MSAQEAMQVSQAAIDQSCAELYPNGVSIPKACDIAGVSRRTIYNWMAAGKLSYWRTAGGAVRISAQSLLRGRA